MYEELLNQRFGKLVVIKEAPMLKNKSYRFYCRKYKDMLRYYCHFIVFMI